MAKSCFLDLKNFTGSNRDDPPLNANTLKEEVRQRKGVLSTQEGLLFRIEKLLLESIKKMYAQREEPHFLVGEHSEEEKKCNRKNLSKNIVARVKTTLSRLVQGKKNREVRYRKPVNEAQKGNHGRRAGLGCTPTGKVKRADWKKDSLTGGSERVSSLGAEKNETPERARRGGNNGKRGSPLHTYSKRHSFTPQSGEGPSAENEKKVAVTPLVEVVEGQIWDGSSIPSVESISGRRF